MNEWQPIETAPHDEYAADLWVKCTYDPEQSGRKTDCIYRNGDWLWWDDCYDGRGGYIGVHNGTTYVATHWMRVEPPSDRT